jgi:hypothetical protein
MKLQTLFMRARIVVVLLLFALTATVAVSVFAQPTPAPPPAATTPAPAATATAPAADPKQAAGEAKLEGLLAALTTKFHVPAAQKTSTLNGGPATYTIPFSDFPVMLVVTPHTFEIPNVASYSYHIVESWGVLLPAQSGTGWSQAMLQKIAEANGTLLGKVGIDDQGSILAYETFHLEGVTDLDFAAHISLLTSVSGQCQKQFQDLLAAESTPGATSGPSAPTSLGAARNARRK